jgi:hypothetical protein
VTAGRANEDALRNRPPPGVSTREPVTPPIAEVPAEPFAKVPLEVPAELPVEAVPPVELEPSAVVPTGGTGKTRVPGATNKPPGLVTPMAVPIPTGGRDTG